MAATRRRVWTDREVCEVLMREVNRLDNSYLNTENVPAPSYEELESSFTVNDFGDDFDIAKYLFEPDVNGNNYGDYSNFLPCDIPNIPSTSRTAPSIFTESVVSSSSSLPSLVPFTELNGLENNIKPKPSVQRARSPNLKKPRLASSVAVVPVLYKKPTPSRTVEVPQKERCSEPKPRSSYADYDQIPALERLIAKSKKVPVHEKTVLKKDVPRGVLTNVDFSKLSVDQKKPSKKSQKDVDKKCGKSSIESTATRTSNTSQSSATKKVSSQSSKKSDATPSTSSPARKEKISEADSLVAKFRGHPEQKELMAIELKKRRDRSDARARLKHEKQRERARYLAHVQQQMGHR